VETWIHMQLCSGEIDRDQALDYMAHWPEIYDALKSGTNPFSAAGYEPEPSP
jgi:L-lysine 2,3-aminomutase